MRSPAFSLVEVIVALGIFSFAVVGIVYLLGSGLSSSRDSAKDSSIAAALHGLDATMRTLPSATLTALTTGTSPMTSGTNLYFDLFGNITSGTASNIYYTANVQRVDPTSVGTLTGISTSGSVPFPQTQVTDSQSRQFLWKVTFYYPYVSASNFGPMTTHMLIGQTSYDSVP